MEFNIGTAYELELNKIAEQIKKEKARLVLLQFPDGLKKQSTEAAEYLEEHTKATCLIWLGSCFGACDIPPVQNLKEIDLIVQFGHTAWPYHKNKDIKIIKI